MLLRPVGMTSSVSRVNCVVAVVEVTSTSGASPETVIVSASALTLSTTSTLAVNPAVIRRSGRLTVPKPSSAYSTV